MSRIEILADGIELHLGDCREVLAALAPHDALCADPPYGIEYSSGTTNRKRGKAVYSGAFADTRENVRINVIPSIEAALELCGGRGTITPGSPCMWLYPEPSVLGGFYQPAAVGMNRWGFASFNPVCFYGKDPRAGKSLSATAIQITERPSNTEHPCAKPLRAVEWMVGKVSLPGERVLDPYMGSGTTGVACVKLGRRFTGIEIDAGYFEIALRRIEETLRQPQLIEVAA